MNTIAMDKPSWAARILLALLCLSTLPYGIQCLIDPKADILRAVQLHNLRHLIEVQERQRL